MTTPYDSFAEWEFDLARIRSHPNDEHLIRHVRDRVNMSSDEIKDQVKEYLQDAAFANNPIPAGQDLAKRTNKWFFIRHPQDPWWYA